MDSLCISKALELHRIVSPYLPVIAGQEDALSVVHQIIDNMKDNNPKAYLDSILLMSGWTVEMLMEMDSQDILTMFVDGLSVNQIIALDSFCRKLGVNHG